MSERVGFVGLGIMGKPMARNLLRAGYALTVQSRSPGPVEELAREGAATAATAREVAARSDVIITMLPDTPDVEEVVAGPGGVLAGARPGALVIDMSTISPVAARGLAEEAERRGVAMLDAPVSGGDRGAVAGTLSIMVGGDPAAYERARPLFEVMGGTIVHCGPSGAGQTVKACNQVVVAVTMEAVSEALVLGSKAGVDPEVIVRVLGGGLAGSRILELKGPAMVERSFEPGFKARLHRKDLGIALQAARRYGVALPTTALVDQLFTTLVERGWGDSDHSALVTVVEELAGHRLGDEEKD